MIIELLMETMTLRSTALLTKHLHLKHKPQKVCTSYFLNFWL